MIFRSLFDIDLFVGLAHLRGRCQLLSIALKNFCPVFYSHYINGNVKILWVAVIEVILRQELKSLQDFSMVTNHAPRLIGINLHIDRTAVVTAWNGRIHIHFINHYLNIGCHISYDFFDIVVFLYLDTKVWNQTRLILLSLVLWLSQGYAHALFFKNRISSFSCLRISVLISSETTSPFFNLLDRSNHAPKVNCCFAHGLHRFVLCINFRPVHLLTAFFDWLFTTVVSAIGSISTWAGFSQTSQENLSFTCYNCNMCLHEEYLNRFRPFWIASSTVAPVYRTICPPLSYFLFCAFVLGHGVFVFSMSREALLFASRSAIILKGLFKEIGLPDW